MKIDELPSQYEPFRRVRIGTNLLENVNTILVVNGHVPFIIGQGKPPRVWLYIPTNKEGTEWYPLIKDNFSSHPDVVVKSAPKMLTIKTPETTVLACMLGNDDVIHITKLDLRPFGLDVFSDQKSLNVMGNTLSSNTFKNIRTVIAIG